MTFNSGGCKARPKDFTTGAAARTVRTNGAETTVGSFSAIKSTSKENSRSAGVIELDVSKKSFLLVDAQAKIGVAWTSGIKERFCAGQRINVHSAPAALVQAVGVGKARGMMRAHINVKTGRLIGKNLLEQQVLAFLREGNAPVFEVSF
jgi:hypothetical protein